MKFTRVHTIIRGVSLNCTMNNRVAMPDTHLNDQRETAVPAVIPVASTLAEILGSCN